MKKRLFLSIINALLLVFSVEAESISMALYSPYVDGDRAFGLSALRYSDDRFGAALRLDLGDTSSDDRYSLTSIKLTPGPFRLYGDFLSLPSVSVNVLSNDIATGESGLSLIRAGYSGIVGPLSFELTAGSLFVPEKTFPVQISTLRFSAFPMPVVTSRVSFRDFSLILAGGKGTGSLYIDSCDIGSFSGWGGVVALQWKNFGIGYIGAHADGAISAYALDMFSAVVSGNATFRALVGWGTFSLKRGDLSLDMAAGYGLLWAPETVSWGSYAYKGASVPLSYQIVSDPSWTALGNVRLSWHCHPSIDVSVGRIVIIPPDISVVASETTAGENESGSAILSKSLDWRTVLFSGCGISMCVKL